MSEPGISKVWSPRRVPRRNRTPLIPMDPGIAAMQTAVHDRQISVKGVGFRRELAEPSLRGVVRTRFPRVAKDPFLQSSSNPGLVRRQVYLPANSDVRQNGEPTWYQFEQALP